MTITVDEPRSSRTPAIAGMLSKPEAILVIILLLVVSLCTVISVFKAQPIAWGQFGLGLAPTAGLLAVGVYIRLFKHQPRIAELAIANALFLGFMGLTTLLIYLRFPIRELSFDLMLIKLDGIVGYSWPEFVEWIATYPEFGRSLRVVYHSSLPQLFVMVGFLALTGRSDTLNKALLAGSFSLLLTTLIWWIAPSVGPSAFFDLPATLEDSVRLVSGEAYAEILRTLSRDGLEVISPSDIVGTIAFPSYHTVMALLVVWYLRRTLLFIPAVLVNAAMVPAILSHGGHHLIDMVGGIAVFALAAWLANWPWLSRPLR